MRTQRRNPRDPHIGFRARYCHWCGDLLIPANSGAHYPQCTDCDAGDFCSVTCLDAHRDLAQKRAPR
jgi:hypothetical protein